MALDSFKERMDLWIKTFKNSNAVEGKRVIIPGEQETLAHANRERDGIPIQEKVAKDLEELSKKLSLDLPF